MLAMLLLTTAIVVQDNIPLRSAPRDSAVQQSVLWQGDTVEIRGESQDFLQVYDYRRERGGYVRAIHVRNYPEESSTASELMTIIRFLRDSPGAEALGIAYVALFLKAAEPADIGAEIFDALGTFGERLASRASARKGKPGDDTIASHLDVARHYGLQFQSFERKGRMQTCYDGEAFRRVMALPSTLEQKARAALALTYQECIRPDLGPVQLHAVELWNSELLDSVETTLLPQHIANRIRLRRASVWARVAHNKARQGEPPQEAGRRALQELAAVNKSELAEEDGIAYNEAAVWAGASRWAAEDLHGKATILAIHTTQRQPGETCIQLMDTRQNSDQPLMERCTYGVVWKSSVSVSPKDNALALAVQPLDSWREMWLFHQTEAGWSVDVLPPSAEGPDFGYLECAGWSPDGSKVLLAREFRSGVRFKKSFEILDLSSLEIEKQAESPGALTPFYRWQDPEWKRGTLSLR